MVISSSWIWFASDQQNSSSTLISFPYTISPFSHQLSQNGHWSIRHPRQEYYVPAFTVTALHRDSSSPDTSVVPQAPVLKDAYHYSTPGCDRLPLEANSFKSSFYRVADCDLFSLSLELWGMIVSSRYTIFPIRRLRGGASRMVIVGLDCHWEPICSSRSLRFIDPIFGTCFGLVDCCVNVDTRASPRSWAPGFTFPSHLKHAPRILRFLNSITTW